MTEFSCSYGDDRDEAIVALLYDDLDASPAERNRFETHLGGCARCQADVAALRGVRAQLARWSPPEPSFAVVSRQSVVASLETAARNPEWWRVIPAWAQVAAALLFLGVSAGIANLDVRYNQSGLSIRTGWSTRPAATAGVEQPGVARADQTAPWRADIAALEQQLKSEIRAAQASSTSVPAASMRTVSASAADADVTRRFRALVEESEKRQQRELALRIAGLLRDVNAQRQADMIKIDRTLGVVQNNVGIEVMKNRQQMNQMDLIYRASQRQ
jgi:anti-sigma factor RsiW